MSIKLLKIPMEFNKGHISRSFDLFTFHVKIMRVVVVLYTFKNV